MDVECIIRETQATGSNYDLASIAINFSGAGQDLVLNDKLISKRGETFILNRYSKVKRTFYTTLKEIAGTQGAMDPSLYGAPYNLSPTLIWGMQVVCNNPYADH